MQTAVELTAVKQAVSAAVQPVQKFQVGSGKVNSVQLHHTLRVCGLRGSSTVQQVVSLDKKWTGRLAGQDKVSLEKVSVRPAPRGLDHRPAGLVGNSPSERCLV